MLDVSEQLRTDGGIEMLLDNAGIPISSPCLLARVVVEPDIGVAAESHLGPSVIYPLTSTSVGDLSALIRHGLPPGLE